MRAAASQIVRRSGRHPGVATHEHAGQTVFAGFLIVEGIKEIDTNVNRQASALSVAGRSAELLSEPEKRETVSLC
jgi:hypothetical protein